MRIGIGVTTYQRPEMAEKCVKALMRHCAFVDQIELYNDGSDPKFRGAYSRAYRPLLEHKNANVTDAKDNHGVAYAKNRLITRLLSGGCDWIILCEDDIKVLNADAVWRYVTACQKNSLHHLSFAHHGPANVDGPVAVDGDIAYFEHSIGAWSIFSRECLLGAGTFDENFVCAWEHVEHELRLMQHGYMRGADVHRFPDVASSSECLVELPGSIEKSSIRPRDDWATNIRNGLLYWRERKPETYNMLFGPGTQLEHYAANVIGIHADA